MVLFAEIHDSVTDTFIGYLVLVILLVLILIQVRWDYILDFRYKILVKERRQDRKRSSPFMFFSIILYIYYYYKANRKPQKFIKYFCTVSDTYLSDPPIVLPVVYIVVLLTYSFSAHSYYTAVMF